MTLSSLTYAPPVRRSLRPARADYALLETAVELAEQGRPMESLAKVFEHLFPNATLPDLVKEPFTFVQGSSQVTARIEGDHLIVKVPLVRLPAGGSAVAALRYVLTKISSTGQLYQPRLSSDDLYLEFRDALSRLHPAKVLEVLRRMPIEADSSDDWLIGQFQALPLERAEIKPLDADELARCEAIWRGHFADVEELCKEAQRKQSMFFLNELTAYALYRVQFALPLCGFLGARLAEAASTFNDTDEDPHKRESTLAKLAREMKAIASAELHGSLGHAEYAISPLEDGTPALISQYFGDGDYMETIDKLRGSGKPLDAAIALIGTYNFLLARYCWPEPVEAELVAGLAQASGKPWREAAGVLFDHARELAATYGAAEDPEDEDEDDEDDDDDEDDEDDEEGDEDSE